MFQELKHSLNGIGNLYRKSKAIACIIVVSYKRISSLENIDLTISYTININVVAKYILAACFRNRYPCIKIMQYQSLHKFTLNSITERDNVMECFCWRRTLNRTHWIFLDVQALLNFKVHAGK